jgi:hypothetical protein
MGNVGAPVVKELVGRAEYIFHQTGRTGVRDLVAEFRVDDDVKHD